MTQSTRPHAVLASVRTRGWGALPCRITGSISSAGMATSCVRSISKSRAKMRSPGPWNCGRATRSRYGSARGSCAGSLSPHPSSDDLLAPSVRPTSSIPSAGPHRPHPAEIGRGAADKLIVNPASVCAFSGQRYAGLPSIRSEQEIECSQSIGSREAFLSRGRPRSCRAPPRRSQKLSCGRMM